ncbi:hypothetical protein [Paenibacillus contaminans]|nr:hypothetical protein [Paenibacillus contaminans]
MPIAVFNNKRVGEETDEFRVAFPFFNVLQFRFQKLELNKDKRLRRP